MPRRVLFISPERQLKRPPLGAASAARDEPCVFVPIRVGVGPSAARAKGDFRPPPSRTERPNPCLRPSGARIAPSDVDRHRGAPHQPRRDAGAASPDCPSATRRAARPCRTHAANIAIGRSAWRVRSRARVCGEDIFRRRPRRFSSCGLHAFAAILHRIAVVPANPCHAPSALCERGLDAG